MTRSSIVLVLLAACGGGGGGGDDGVDPDGPPGTPDAPPTGDCSPDEACFTLAPIDDVTALPPGRLAVAWIDFNDGDEIGEIGYDVPWNAPATTRIRLDALAAPSPVLGMSQACGESTITIWLGLIAVSTDPDGSGSVSFEELLAGWEADTVYGIAQGIFIEAPDGCDEPLGLFPGGLEPGRHVYAGNESTFFHLADGVPFELTTCMPGADACTALTGPV